MVVTPCCGLGNLRRELSRHGSGKRSDRASQSSAGDSADCSGQHFARDVSFACCSRFLVIGVEVEVVERCQRDMEVECVLD
jgi:hypothetical protein